MATQTVTKNPLMMCFENSEPKPVQIARAVKILLELLGKPENPVLMERWAQLLQPIPGEQLAVAFTAAALTCTGWPTLGDITGPIFDQEFADELAWILVGLRRHKRDWQDRDAVYGPQKRVPGDGQFDWVRGDLIEAAIPAPTIPRRLREALGVLGATGDLGDGLEQMSRHPAVGAIHWDAVEAGKVKFQIERDFRSAWMVVRRRELAG